MLHPLTRVFPVCPFHLLQRYRRRQFRRLLQLRRRQIRNQYQIGALLTHLKNSLTADEINNFSSTTGENSLIVKDYSEN